MIYLGADHGGYELKNIIKTFLDNNGYEYEDLGNLEYDKEDDYPVYAFKVAQVVGTEDNTTKNWSDRPKGILICRSSGGVVIAANKVKGVRAVSVMDIKSSEHARLHNDANVIGISGDWMTTEIALEVVKVFIETEYSREDRHTRRLDIIKDFEDKN